MSKEQSATRGGSPDNRTPAKVAAQLQQDLFAHPQAGKIPVTASTIMLAIQELRRLQEACDKHSEADLLLETSRSETPPIQFKDWWNSCSTRIPENPIDLAKFAYEAGQTALSAIRESPDAKDAERYRWLRGYTTDYTHMCHQALCDTAMDEWIDKEMSRG